MKPKGLRQTPGTASIIDPRINHDIEICTELSGIDPCGLP